MTDDDDQECLFVMIDSEVCGQDNAEDNKRGGCAIVEVANSLPVC